MCSWDLARPGTPLPELASEGGAYGSGDPIPTPYEYPTLQLVTPEAIAAFLRQHPWLVPLLQEADRALLGAFPEEPCIHLAVSRDPDTIEGEYLVYGIVSRQPLAGARACLTTFDESWLLDNVERFQEKVLFRLRFA